MTFHEYDDTGRAPKHELSRRLLNEIVEFRAVDDNDKEPFLDR